MANQNTSVTTGEVRMSFVHLFKPYAYQPGDPEKYSVTCILPKSDIATKQRLDAAIAAAEQLGVQNKWGGVKPPHVPNPIWDGDGVKQDGTPFGAECKGAWVFSASANADFAPEVVDADLNPIINQSEIYSGIYGRVNINVFAYAAKGKKGIGFGLGPVQKLRDGEPLTTSRTTAQQAFGAFVQQATVDPITGQPL